MQRSALFAWIVITVAVALLASLWVQQQPDLPVLSFLFWVALLAAIELLPVYMGFRIELTMGFVIILPVVILFPTPVAMAIVGLGSVDPRELRLELPVHKALFNRAQSMLAAAAASVPFTVLGQPRFSFTGVVTAALLHFLVNLGLVAVAVAIERRSAFRTVFVELLPQPVTGFAITYALLTGLGTATAVVYNRDHGGGWAVAAVLIPLLFARMSIIGARNQQELSERLQRQQKALLTSTERIFEEREKERRRIGATIHDSSLQLMAGAAYASGNAADALDRRDVDAARRLITTAREAIDQASESLRGSVVALRRSAVEDGGLMPTIRKFAEDVTTLWGTDVVVEGRVVHEPPVPVSLVAFQILQEGVTNSLKHSDSERVSVRVSEEDGMVHIVVEDSGDGFDPEAANDESHVGLTLIKERAETLGGHVRLDSSPGRGTRLTAVLPAGAQA